MCNVYMMMCVRPIVFEEMTVIVYLSVLSVETDS